MAKQYSLEDEAQQISAIACASAKSLIQEWGQNDYSFNVFNYLSKALNLKQSLQLLNADENTLGQVDQFLLDTLQRQMDLLIKNEGDVCRFSYTIVDLFKAKAIHPEHLEIIHHGYNQLRKKITTLNGRDFTGFLNIAIRLGENPQEEFGQWLAAQRRLTSNELALFTKPLAKIIVFDDTNLEVFKKFIKKFIPMKLLLVIM